MFSNQKKVHLMGIGGIGMSGIAQILLAQGCRVSGCDVKASSLTEKLQQLGANIVIGHAPDHLDDVEVLVYSSAIAKDNPELVGAYARNLVVLWRAQALALLANQKKTISVTGAHGKTTTSSMIAHILAKCNLKPTICVGGELFSLNGNAFRGESNYFVLEADESDGSFLHLAPLYSVVTNIDREHLDYYRDLEHICATFRAFLSNTRKEGAIFFCQDDPMLSKVVSSLGITALGYGFSADAAVTARDIVVESGRSRFTFFEREKALGEVTLEIPGRHNISNALAAIAVGLKIGLDFSAICQALTSFKGVRRRMELKLREKGILVFEDYAHHPTEIKVTLEALKTFGPKRILAVFQPHRYSRTKFLLPEFGRCFAGVDQLIVTDIYAASETPIAGISGRCVCQEAEKAKVREVFFLPKQEIVAHLLGQLRPGDLVAIMGAGDIGNLSNVLAEAVKKSDQL
ncbi:MAG: UDP-N-acetylmuramate--L-alanine ligase [Candidatus Omnitrophota bacterium]